MPLQHARSTTLDQARALFFFRVHPIVSSGILPKSRVSNTGASWNRRNCPSQRMS